jgi:hypothetical protein
MLSRDYLIHSDHASRVASLDLNTEDDVPWSELIDEGWNRWTAEKLRTRWAALKGTVDASATHRGEYITHG